MTLTPVGYSRLMFNSYAGMDAPALPDDPFSALQVRLVRWQTQNFGSASQLELLAGITEEAGELAHAILKRSQRIRGMEDPAVFREAAGDAIADMTIYAMQLCTALRLDFGVLVSETAQAVMKRDWVSNPQGNGG